MQETVFIMKQEVLSIQLSMNRKNWLYNWHIYEG